MLLAWQEQLLSRYEAGDFLTEADYWDIANLLTSHLASTNYPDTRVLRALACHFAFGWIHPSSIPVQYWPPDFFPACTYVKRYGPYWQEALFAKNELLSNVYLSGQLEPEYLNPFRDSILSEIATRTSVPPGTFRALVCLVNQGLIPISMVPNVLLPLPLVECPTSIFVQKFPSHPGTSTQAFRSARAPTYVRRTFQRASGDDPNTSSAPVPASANQDTMGPLQSPSPSGTSTATGLWVGVGLALGAYGLWSLSKGGK